MKRVIIYKSLFLLSVTVKASAFTTIRHCERNEATPRPFAAQPLQFNTLKQPKKCRPCSTKPNIFKKTANLMNAILKDGKNELYIPSYAWHNRYLYSKEKIQTYNENPWGGGLGKSYYDASGDWHGLYAFAFLDSHKNVEPILGYAFLKILKITDNTNIGGGYAILATARPDINHGIPFPGALPWASVSHKKVSFVATYIPGARGVGNVLFLITKVLI